MKLYRTNSRIILQNNDSYFQLNDEDWDTLINDDNLFTKLTNASKNLAVSDVKGLLKNEILPPIGSQEIWAAGVTYIRSKVGRQEESKESGGGDFYARVYEAERPEIFFKATPHRVVGHEGKVRLRKDSTWNVPEPELTLVVTSSGKIVGYTIGNDMSSRSIEGENPLYLPQAKTYDGSAALGPCIFVTNKPLPLDTLIEIEINRDNKKVFSGEVAINQIKRKFEELVSFQYRECSFPSGSFLMTGTGIVPGNEFTLQSGDEIKITIGPIGSLINTVE
jgi:2-dehydro-3-deoxy-D-arabinonate dehydratase